MVIDNLAILFKKNDFLVLEREDFYLVVTHGDREGNLQSPLGKLMPASEFVSHFSKKYKEKELYVVACHEEARDNIGLYPAVDVTPIGQEGKIKVKFHQYIDGDLGDLIIG